MGLTDSWLATLAIWASAAALYYVTLFYADRRQRRRRMPALDDLGFDLTPRLPQLQKYVDFCGVGGSIWMVSVLLFSGDHETREYIRALLDYNALGNVFSSTLHLVTILPTAEFEESKFAGMGGNADKLMSNHTFNFGVGLHACTLIYSWPAWALPAGVGIYSYCLCCTRCHYSVDIVLAWWFLFFVLHLDPGLKGAWLAL